MGQKDTTPHTFHIAAELTKTAIKKIKFKNKEAIKQGALFIFLSVPGCGRSSKAPFLN